MLTTHAVGIDLGTTYSCISYLNEHGEPVTIPNAEGELSTPSVVLFETDRVIVGTEALRNSILQPNRVVQNAKRYMGNPSRRWTIDGRQYTPVDVSSFILKKLLNDAERQIGKIERAVITVPAQFGDLQRRLTVEAGIKAGLAQVDIINEPVAAALCYVLGAEGLWFSELASEQRILVYDLGGGTFDLSLVNYQQNAVRVIASSGDLHLGGIDWNQALLDAVADDFMKEFDSDPRSDPESLQSLAWEVEQAKRSLSVRPKAALVCQHSGFRKTYQIEQERFNRLTAPLVERTKDVTLGILKDNKMGWAHVDVVLITGGASRMPMVRDMLKQLSGRTLNTSLSPDQSIAHGATYYAGMLISNSEFVHSILNAEASARLSGFQQQSVTARGLGILIRDPQAKKRVPHYLIPANTPLPASATQIFGTVVPNQRRVHLYVVESGPQADAPCVDIGACVVNDLPANLPVESEIAVTISYDESARVHVSAKDVTSGKEATIEIIRQENLAHREVPPADSEVEMRSAQLPADKSNPASPAPAKLARPTRQEDDATVADQPKPAAKSGMSSVVDSSSLPIPLCNQCGEALNSRGACSVCGAIPARSRPQPQASAARPATSVPIAKPVASSTKPASRPAAATKPPTAKPIPSGSANIKRPAVRPSIKPTPAPKPVSPPPVKNSAAASTSGMLQSRSKPAPPDEILELEDSAILELLKKPPTKKP